MKDDEQKKKKKKGGGKAVSGIADVFIRIALSLKRVSVNYSQDWNTTVPGFMPSPEFIGLSTGSRAPGIGFIAGQQPDRKWLNDAASNGWLSTATTFNQLLLSNYSSNLDIKVRLEPLRDFNIDLNLNRSFTKNHSEYFRNTGTLTEPDFNSQNGSDNGSFSVSYSTWKTIFDTRDDQDISETFKQFEANREVIADRLAAENLYSQDDFFTNPLGDTINPNYNEGYGPYSQDVLIPAFVAAYTGQDPNKTKLNVFKTIPRPNWRVTYNGLSKIKALENVITNFNISHGYSSTLSVNSYNSDLNFDGNFFLFGHVIDTLSGNFYSLYNIPNIVISEQLSPLIGVDITWANDISTKVDFKKTRSMSMSFTDYQLTENKSTEFTVGVGYKLKGFTTPFKIKGKKRNLENDITIKFDMSFRDDIVINYRLDQDLAEPTGGIKSISINPTIDYVVNDRLNVQLFFDRKKSIPKISSSFPVTTTNAGIKVRFTLAE